MLTLKLPGLITKSAVAFGVADGRSPWNHGCFTRLIDAHYGGNGSSF